MKKFTLLLLLALSSQLFAQPHRHDANPAIYFPDVPGYKTLRCDFHIHSVFSDGSVWPDIRVQEAVRDSLDAISLTEHLEYQPHKQDIPNPDRNRAYQLAEEYARPYGLVITPGAEITREMPPGHTNAIFIQDANKLLKDDPYEVFEEAVKRQGDFTFLNHPHWVAQRKDGIATLTDMHRQLISQQLLHGIEVVNETTYSDEALQIALDNNLTIMGTSDIHGLVAWTFKLDEGGHRPVTLVFAKEKTNESIREALFAQRTAVWHNNTLIGREEHLLPLLNAAISIVSAEYIGPSAVIKVKIKNDSDAAFLLMNQSQFSFHDDAGLLVLAPGSTTIFDVKTVEQLPSFELRFDVLNAVTAPGKRLQIRMPVKVSG